MGYIITATNEDGEGIAEFSTFLNMFPAHELCAALGIEQDESDTAGSGETFYYTAGEISAAQAALVLTANNYKGEQDFWDAQQFLCDTMNWLLEHPNETGVEITFA